MNKLFKIALLLALAVGSFGAYRYVSAQENRSTFGRAHVNFPSFDVQISQEPEALATNHVLLRTYNNTGVYSGGSVAASAYTPIDTQLTVQCPGTSGTCTIQADMWIQVFGDGSTDNQNSICLYVDGNPSTFCGYYTSQSPSDGSVVQPTTSQSVTALAHGNHTVQTYFYSQNVAFPGFYNTNYRVYKP